MTIDWGTELPWRNNCNVTTSGWRVCSIACYSKAWGRRKEKQHPPERGTRCGLQSRIGGWSGTILLTVETCGSYASVYADTVHKSFIYFKLFCVIYLLSFICDRLESVKGKKNKKDWKERLQRLRENARRKKKLRKELPVKLLREKLLLLKGVRRKLCPLALNLKKGLMSLE